MNIPYLLLGILVNLVWGLAFFVPYSLKQVDPALLVLSRYFFYGIVSLILLSTTAAHWRSLTRLDWHKAMLFSFAANLGYYFAVVLAIHYSGIVLPTLIVGALPITMMVYGNFKNSEFPFSRLILPILLISTGIIGLKLLPHSGVSFATSTSALISGIALSLLALGIWTWYGVSNANYLKQNFKLSGYSWSLAIGVCCLMQVIIIFPIYFFINPATVLNTFQNHTLFYKMIFGGFILGVIVSWLATTGWNKVSQKLPTVLIGQLLVFETISSLLYGYIHDRHIPPLSIIICIAIALAGIVMGLRVTLTGKLKIIADAKQD